MKTKTICNNQGSVRICHAWHHYRVSTSQPSPVTKKIRVFLLALLPWQKRWKHGTAGSATGGRPIVNRLVAIQYIPYMCTTLHEFMNTKRHVWTHPFVTCPFPVEEHHLSNQDHRNLYSEISSLFKKFVTDPIILTPIPHYMLSSTYQFFQTSSSSSK